MGKNKASITATVVNNQKGTTTHTARYVETIIVNGSEVPDPNEVNPGVKI